MTTRLHGLLLAGGKSSRMGCDKASLVLFGGGPTQAQRAVGLLRKFCARTCVSLRPGQAVPEGLEHIPALLDSPLAQGPLSGILAAFEEDPDAAWLVLACDLPFVNGELLALLVARHFVEPATPFLAFASSGDGLPEPLCAIYGPAAWPFLKRHAARGHFSPRHIMAEENAALLQLPEGAAGALMNLNTPQDLEEAIAAASRD
jgi:molybdopterin-guanine dinucleotide biosynthesis protein A